MADTTITIPIEEYKELVKAQELLETTKRALQKNRYMNKEELAVLLNVNLGYETN